MTMEEAKHELIIRINEYFTEIENYYYYEKANKENPY